MTRKELSKNKPYPELVEKEKGEKPWEIIDTETLNQSRPGHDVGGAASNVKRVMAVPLDVRSAFISVHELGHVRWSPKEVPKVRYPEAVLQAVEDARVNLGLRKLGLMPHEYMDPAITGIVEAGIEDSQREENADLVLRAVSMLGTPAERRFRKMLKGLNSDWAPLALDWMRRVETTLEASSKRTQSAVGTFNKTRELSKSLAEELAFQQRQDQEEEDAIDKAGNEAYHDVSDQMGTDDDDAAEAESKARAEKTEEIEKEKVKARVQGKKPESPKAKPKPAPSNPGGMGDASHKTAPPSMPTKRPKPRLSLSPSMARHGRVNPNAMMAGVKIRPSAPKSTRAVSRDTRNKSKYIPEFPNPHSCPIGDMRGYHESKPEWAKMTIERPKMTVPQRRVTTLKSRMPGSAVEGCMIRRPDRFLIDGAIFSRRKGGRGVAVLIDQSGSMSLTMEQVESIGVAAGGNSIVATYAGQDDYGTMKIVAENERRATRSDSYISYGANAIDYPALQWLASHTGPKVWVSDGGVGGTNGYSYGHFLECYDLCQDANIVAVPDAESAILYLRQTLNPSAIERNMNYSQE